MSRNVARFSILGVIAVLVLAATTGCFFGGGEEPEPTATPDLAATIAAAVEAAVPTETPIPPTDTPEPPTPEPTPNIAGNHRRQHRSDPRRHAHQHAGTDSDADPHAHQHARAYQYARTHPGSYCHTRKQPRQPDTVHRRWRGQGQWRAGQQHSGCGHQKRWHRPRRSG